MPAASKRRLLVVTPDFPPAVGGIQHLTARLVENLGAWDARVLAPSHPLAGDHDVRAGAEVVRVRKQMPAPKLANALLNAAAVREAWRWRPDVVLSMHVIAAPSAVAIAGLMRRPVVQYLHANELAARPRLMRSALRAARSAIAVSRHTRRLAVSLGAEAGLIAVIPPGVDLPADPARHPAERPTVITVARLTQPYKGHDLMIHAMGLVRTTIPDARWVVVGDGPLRDSIERLAAEQGVADAIELVGEVSDRERDALLAEAHVFAMPSRLPPGGEGGEGFGIVYLEAAVRGLPAVAGNVGGAVDAVEHGVTGLLVDPTEPAAIAAALTELLSDDHRASALGQAGRARAQDFAWPRIAARVDAVLEAAVRGAPLPD